MRRFLLLTFVLSSVCLYGAWFDNSGSNPRDPGTGTDPLIMTSWMYLINNGADPNEASYILYYDDRLKTMAIKIQPNNPNILTLQPGTGTSLYLFENSNPKLFGYIKDACDKSYDSWAPFSGWGGTLQKPVRGSIAFHYRLRTIVINNTPVIFNIIVGAEFKPYSY